MSVEYLSKQLREQRGPLVEQMQDILRKANEENRELTAEEKEQFDKLDKDQQALKDRADRQERIECFERETDDCHDRRSTQPQHATCHGDGSSDSRGTIATGRGDDEDRSRPTIGQALRGWLLMPSGQVQQSDIDAMQAFGINGGQRQLTLQCTRNGLRPRSLHEARERERDMYERIARGEYRAQSVGTTTAGGYTVPDEMMAAIDVALLQFGGMLATSSVLETATGADLPVPTTNDTAQKGAILAENTTATEQDVTFGQVVLQAYKYQSKMVRVSYELLQDSNVNVPELLGRLLGERIGRIINDHFSTGTGTGQPNGIVTAATSSGVTAAAAQYTWQEILQLKHSVDPAYRGPGSGFMGNDTTLRLLKTTVDSQQRPIWLPNLTAGEPDRFDGHPFYINQSMASGSSAKALLFGQLDKYMIRRVMSFDLLRLDERYAEYAQVAWLGFARYDGDLIDAGTNPVKYLTNAA